MAKVLKEPHVSVKAQTCHAIAVAVTNMKLGPSASNTEQIGDSLRKDATQM